MSQGNHQTLALDLGILCEQMLRERGTLLRGLAHPVIFTSSFGASAVASSSGLEGGDDEGGSAGADAAAGSAGVGANGGGTSSDGSSLLPWDTLPAFGRGLQALSDGRGPGEALAAMLPGVPQQASATGRPTDGRSSFREFMMEFGAVPVSPSAFYRLMRNGEAVLLFPGGVREAYKQRGEEYQLFWPGRPEFVRMAARFGATIVPFAAGAQLAAGASACRAAACSAGPNTALAPFPPPLLQTTPPSRPGRRPHNGGRPLRAAASANCGPTPCGALGRSSGCAARRE